MRESDRHGRSFLTPIVSASNPTGGISPIGPWFDCYVLMGFLPSTEPAVHAIRRTRPDVLIQSRRRDARRSAWSTDVPIVGELGAGNQT